MTITAAQAKDLTAEYKKANPHPEMEVELELIYQEISRRANLGYLEASIPQQRLRVIGDRFYDDLQERICSLGFQIRSGCSDSMMRVSWW